MTAYIGSTTAQTVVEWPRSGLPEELEERLRAAYAVALPIAKVESELVAQGFLTEEQDVLELYKFNVTILRDVDAPAARAVFMERAKKEFFSNEAIDIEAVKQRLEKWVAQAKMPLHTKYTLSVKKRMEVYKLFKLKTLYRIT
jgi:hypothetical protein